MGIGCWAKVSLSSADTIPPRRAHTLARTPTLTEEDLPFLDADFYADFVSLIGTVEDPRREHGRRHDLDTILFTLLCAQMAGITSCNGAANFAADAAPWLAKYVRIDAAGGTPNHKTFGRVLTRLRPEGLDVLLREVAERQRLVRMDAPGKPPPVLSGVNLPNPDGGEGTVPVLRHLALDGKTVARSITVAEAQTSRADGGRTHLVTANVFDCGSGLCVAASGTAEVADADPTPGEARPSEVALARELLGALDLGGACVTLDAGLAHRSVLDVIDAQPAAAWCVRLKGNNRSALSFAEAACAAFDAGQRERVSRLEHRESARQDIRVVDVLDLGAFDQGTDAMGAGLREAFPTARTLIRVTRTRAERGSVAGAKARAAAAGSRATDAHRAYFVSSASCDAAAAANLTRGHWGVENRLHYVLDVAYREDASQARERNLARNLATLRRMARNLLVAGGGNRGGLVDQRRFAVSEPFRDKILNQAFGKK